LIVLCSLAQLTATSNQLLDRPAKCTRGPPSAVSIPPCATFCNAALCIQSEAHHQRCRTTYHVHVLHSLSRSQSPSNSAQRNTPLSLALGASFFPRLACTRPSASMNPRMPSCPAAQLPRWLHRASTLCSTILTRLGASPRSTTSPASPDPLCRA
jgi:hypothetical protein